MNTAFVTGLPVYTGASSFTGESRCATKCPAHVTESTRRGSARMMAEDAGKEKKQGFLDWLHDKIMHNFSSDYGYETYFTEAQTAREEEMKRVRDEVDAADAANELKKQ